jgi:hypothetical protein
MVGVYAAWWDWSGDLYWGPRYFLIAILPASLALAVWLTSDDPRPLPNLAVLGVLAMSLWVGANSTVFAKLKSPHCFPLGSAAEELCRFGVRESALSYPLQAWPRHLSAAKWFQLGYHEVVFVWLAAPVVVRLAHVVGARLTRNAAAPRQRLPVVARGNQERAAPTLQVHVSAIRSPGPSRASTVLRNRSW